MNFCGYCHEPCGEREYCDEVCYEAHEKAMEEFSRWSAATDLEEPTMNSDWCGSKGNNN